MRRAVQFPAGTAVSLKASTVLCADAGLVRFGAIIFRAVFRAAVVRRVVSLSYALSPINCSGTSGHDPCLPAWPSPVSLQLAKRFLSARRQEDHGGRPIPMIFGAFYHAWFGHCRPLFFGRGTKVPSTKHSFRSKPPAFLQMFGHSQQHLRLTPSRTQLLGTVDVTVWYTPYRGGRSCQGAPVRKTQRIPFSHHPTVPPRASTAIGSTR